MSFVTAPQNCPPLPLWNEVLARLPLATALLSATDTWLEVNASLGDWLGRSATSLRGTAFEQVLCPDEWSVCREDRRGLRAGTLPLVRARRYFVRGDGSRVRGELFLTRATAQGADGCLLAQVIDLESQCQVEEALRHSHVTMELAARNADIGFWEYDIVTDRQEWDDETLRIYGLRRDDFRGTGEHWMSLLHPEDRECQIAIASQLWQSSESSAEQEFRIIRPDGEIRHIWRKFLVTRDAQGSPLRMTGVNHDVTAQWSSAEKLRLREAALRRILDHLPIPVAVRELSQQARVIQLNHQFTATFGYTREDIPTVDAWIPLIYPDPGYRAQMRARWAAALASAVASEGVIESIESRMSAKDGSVRDVLVNATVVDDTVVLALQDISVQRQSEARMTRANTQMRLAADAAELGFWSYDIAAKRRDWDEATLRIYGLQREDSMADDDVWIAALHPEDRERVLADSLLRWRQDISTGEHQYRIIRPDGQVRHVWSKFHITRDDSGKALSMTGVTNDVTQRELAAAKLRQSEALLRRILDHLPLPVAVTTYSPEAPLLQINQQFARTFGYTLQDVPTLAAWALRAHPDATYRQQVLAWWDTALAEASQSASRIASADLQVVCKDGSRREVVIHATVVDALVVVALQDVTSDNRLRLELKSARAVLERSAFELTENMPAGTYVLTFGEDGKPRFIFASRRLQEICGLGRDLFMSNALAIFDLTHPDDRPGLDAMNALVVATGCPFRWEGRFLVGDTERWFLVEANPRRTADGVLIWEGVVTDISTRKATELALAKALLHEQESRREAELANAKAQRASEAKSRFLTNVSHEIRTPLSVLVSLANAMWLESLKNPISAEFDEFLNRVRSGGQYLNLILTNMLDLSAVESGHAPLRLESFYVADWLADLQNILEPIASSHQVRLLWRVAEEDDARFHSDPLRLSQIALNLVHNAVKFSGGEWRTVTVGLVTVGNKLWLSVADEGPGIADSRLPGLFEEFTQSDAQAPAFDSGVGLGLAVVKQNCNLLGGDICVDQIPPRGLRFTVTLPAMSEASAVQSRRPPPPPPHHAFDHH